MPVEIRIAAFGAVLLLIYILVATQGKNSQYGAKWNVGARDEPLAEPRPLVGRLMRAQSNYLETFPIAIVALLGVVLAGRTSRQHRAWRLDLARGTRRLPPALCGRRTGSANDRMDGEHCRIGDGDLSAARGLTRPT